VLLNVGEKDLLVLGLFDCTYVFLILFAYQLEVLDRSREVNDRLADRSQTQGHLKVLVLCRVTGGDLALAGEQAVSTLVETFAEKLAFVSEV
jgi:hypothetical protein